MNKQYGIIRYSKKEASSDYSSGMFTGTHGKHGTNIRTQESSHEVEASQLVIDKDGLSRTQFSKKLRNIAKEMSSKSSLAHVELISSFK